MGIYYCSEFNHKIGDILKPGRWRSLIESAPITNVRVPLECAFEFARQVVNNNSVSRLDCIFGFTDIISVEGYIFSSQNHKYIYEVDKVDSGTPHSLHNYEVISYFLALNGFKPVNMLIGKQLFLDYWNSPTALTSIDGTKIDYVEEILIGGDVRIKKIF